MKRLYIYSLKSVLLFGMISTSYALKVSISYGELVDKITILEIKMERMTQAAKKSNVLKELLELQNEFLEWANDLSQLEQKELFALKQELYDTNIQMWDIEDAIREKEQKNEFDEQFIEIARLVYKTNDKRGFIKRVLNDRFGSLFTEEKEYTRY